MEKKEMKNVRPDFFLYFCINLDLGYTGVMCNMKEIDSIQKLMDDSVAKNEAAGVNVLVLKDGKEVCYFESGMRDRENRVPMTRDTIFRLYSMSKPITSAAMALLISRGLIDPSANLSDYLPEYAEMHVNRSTLSGAFAQKERVPAAGPIRVRHLLNMTSGLMYPDEVTASGVQSGKVFAEIESRMRGDNPVSTRDFSRMMARTDLAFEPGENFRYGTSADVCGALVEEVTGMSFRDFLKKEFFEPLYMTDTDFYVPPEKQHRLSKVYEYSADGLKETKPDRLGLIYERDRIPAFQSGGAGLCATMDDYSRFGTMLLNGGEYMGRRIMPKEAVRFMTKGGIRPDQMHQLSDIWTWMPGYTYGNFLRVCVDETQTSIFSRKGEYGWDGWLGTFFSNEPSCGITLCFGVQQIGLEKTGCLVRRIKNVVMSALA